MRARTTLLLVILVVLGIFAAFNWAVFTAPTDLNLLFAQVAAPLGVILLAVIAGITLLYIAFLAWLETAALLEARCHARELDAQRELAQNAKASRYVELQGFLATEPGELRTLPSAEGGRIRRRCNRLSPQPETWGRTMKGIWRTVNER